MSGSSAPRKKIHDYRMFIASRPNEFFYHFNRFWCTESISITKQPFYFIFS